MNKWKDTARTSTEIVRTYSHVDKIILTKNSLVVIIKELSDEVFLVWDTNPKKSERKHYKLKKFELILEDYSITRDINIQMLLADGWDAQDLLKNI